MKRYLQKLLVLFTALFIPLWAYGVVDPPTYSAEAVHGQVVDEDTGKPLEGVVIVARWRPESTLPGASGPGESFKTIEVVTDNEGKYFIPGWGPLASPIFAFLSSHDPELIYFKSDYYPQFLLNPGYSHENRNTNSVRTSIWNGKVIKLKPFKGDWSDYAFRLSGVWNIEFSNDCVRACPRMVLALDAENKRIKAIAPKVPNIINLNSYPFSDSDREFLKRFKDEK